MAVVTHILILLTVVGVIMAQQKPYITVFQWKQLDFDYPTKNIRAQALNTKAFIPENNVITGVKPLGDRLFLTVPRWRDGVPATLVYVNSSQAAFSPLLKPYPSWGMQQLGNCSALQYVQSMEIDQFKRMWIIDVGRVNIFEPTPIHDCPPKLVIVDTTTNQIIRSFTFPPEVASPTTNFLNDIVVGCKTLEDCWAYITNAGEAEIVLYNYEENKSWSWKHSTSMDIQNDATIINILGDDYTFETPVDGIALSSIDTNFTRLYYCPLSSYALYYVNTEALQLFVKEEISEFIVMPVGTKGSQTDGMVIDSKDNLYYGALAKNSVVTIDSLKFLNPDSLNKSLENVLSQNDVDMQWADTFGFDDNGYLYTTTNRLHRFSTNTYNLSDVNFRVLKINVGAKSYMFPGGDGDSGSGISQFATSLGFFVIVVWITHLFR